MATGDVVVRIPLHTRDERRRAERFGAAMPMTVDGHEALSQDLSASGLSFLADRPYVPGARVAIVIEYLLDGHHYPLRCEAEVVRVEPAPGGFRVGARLTPQSQLVDVPAADDPAAPRLRAVD